MIRGAPLLLLTVLAVTACGGNPTVEQALSEALAGDLRQYEAPSEETISGVAGLVEGALNGVDDLEVPAHLELTRIKSDGRDIAVFTERRQRQGFGVYAVRTGTGTPAQMVVEVPHPRADLNTETLGPLLFDSLNADALLVAGTHRSMADVAHQRDTVFAGVDAAIVGAGSVVVQVHGFDESRHDGAAQVVLSSTEARPSPLVRRLADALDAAGFNTCVYDGKRCRALAGTRNVQAAHARSVGAEFVHLELSAELRSEPQERQRLTDTLASVFR